MKNDESGEEQMEMTRRLLSPDICRKARLARDARFDGLFFTGVTSTGIYCRSICPAVPPLEKNVRYFFSAIEASTAGLRPCLRCRPDSAPHSSAWKGKNTTLERAMAILEQGESLNRSEANDKSSRGKGTVANLSERLGISERYLRQLFAKALGVSPKQYETYCRLLLAKSLLHQTSLPITEVAFASGFNSIRRFNEVFQQQLQLSPTQLRRNARVDERSKNLDASLSFYLSYRPPLDWMLLISFYQKRLVEGMEWTFCPNREQSEAKGRQNHEYRGSSSEVLGYGRSFSTQEVSGYFEVLPILSENRVKVTLYLAEHPRASLMPVINRIRRLLDLDADMMQIEQAVTRCTGLQKPFIPGVRIPGVWSVFEAGCRAILGQQVSVEQAVKLVNILVERYGQPIEVNGRQLKLFPSPHCLANATLEELKMPQARRDALIALATKVALEPDAEVSTWLSVKGIGPWTVAYARMRGNFESDVFLATDLVIKQQLKSIYFNPEASQTSDTIQSVSERVAQHISPWGSYVTMMLWHRASMSVLR